MAAKSTVLEKLQQDVTNAFEEIREAIAVREKLLLRQIDVIASQCNQNNLSEDIKFIPDDEIDILECIRSFGKFNLPHLNFANDLYVSEDYICPHVDHETMYKCLNTKDEVDECICSDVIEQVNPVDGKVDPANAKANRVFEDDTIIDETDGLVKESGTIDNGNGKEEGRLEEKTLIMNPFDDKILKKSIENLNEAVLNITLQETQKLIDRSKINFIPIAGDAIENILSDTKNADCKFDSDKNNGNGNRMAQASQTEMTSTSKFKKPSITINNCNGIINLRNISNLTINCSGQTSIQAAEKTSSNTDAGSDIVSSTVRTDEDDPESRTKDNENNSISCEFYNRLIREIKNSIKRHHQNSHKGTTDPQGNQVCNSSPSTESNATESYSRKLLLKNFENLKIVLENNESDTHPVQIEQWLTEIISETEIEPMQSTGILEHSKFSAESNLC